MSEKIIATFDGDSKRFHRFLIDAGQEITGAVYIPKGQEVPGEVIILLRSRKINKEVEK